MFETRAEVKSMFEQFRTVDNVADLYSDRALENHALLVMNALDESISNMDDEEYLINMLLTTGKSHKRFENFSASIFWVNVSKSCKITHTHILTESSFFKVMIDDSLHKYCTNFAFSCISFLGHRRAIFERSKTNNWRQIHNFTRENIRKSDPLCSEYSHHRNPG